MGLHGEMRATHWTLGSAEQTRLCLTMIQGRHIPPHGISVVERKTLRRPGLKNEPGE